VKIRLVSAVSAAAVSAAVAATTLGLGFRFIHRERSAGKFFPVYGVNCASAFRIVRHFDEAKSSWLTGITVSNEVYTIHGAMRFKQRANFLLTCLETQISNKNILHLFFLLI